MTPLLEPAISVRQRWLVCLLIGLPIGILFGPALVSDSSFALRDAGHFYYPLFQWTSEEWAAGRVPLWNPLDGGGTPVVADASSSVFYPGKLLFALPLPFALRFKLYVVAHVVLAAVGAYRLVRYCGCSTHAAVLAAVGYSCGGSVAFQYCNVVFLVGAAWLPWAWQALLCAVERTSWRSAAVLGLVLALMILGGDPQMAVHVVLGGALYIAVAWLAARKNQRELQNAGFVSTPGWKVASGQVSILGAASAIAFLLAAVQILPSREAARDSTRSMYASPRNIYEAARVAWQSVPEGQPKEQPASAQIAVGLLGRPAEHSHHEDAYDFSLGPWRFAELFWPNVFGRMFPTHRRWLGELPAEGRIWTPTIYLGLLTSVLGLSQLRLGSSDVQRNWLTWMFALFAIGSLGWYGIGWLVREIYASAMGGDSSQLGLGQPVGGVYWFLVTFVPGYVQFRYPAKLFVVASLALSLLAAKGWDAAIRRESAGLNLGLKLIAGGSAAGLIGSLMCGDWFLARPWVADPALGPFDAVGSLHGLRWAFGQSLLVSGLSLWLLRRATQHHSLRWQTSLLVLVVAEIAIANRWFVVTAPSSDWHRESLVAASLDQPPANRPTVVYRARAAHWWPSDFKTTSSESRMQQINAWEHDTLFPKHNLLSGVVLVDSPSSLRSGDRDRIWRVARRLGDSRGIVPHENALRLVGAEFVIAPANLELPDDWVSVPTGGLLPAVAVWRVPDPLPESWVVHTMEFAKPLPSQGHPNAIDGRTLEALQTADGPRDFRQAAFVETDSRPADGKVLTRESAEASLAEVTRLSPQHVRVQAELHQRGLLVIRQPFSPGWVARQLTLNGEKEALPILRTNRILQGLLLPAGKHTIELTYEPASFRWGAIISTVAWLAVLIAIGSGCVRRP